MCPTALPSNAPGGSAAAPERTSAGSNRADRAPGAARSLVLALVGSGGDGVALLGDIILGLAARQGLFGVMVQSYGPQIRGGESAAVIRLSEDEVQYEGERADVVLCFRLRDLARFQGAVQLHAGSALVMDAGDEGSPPEWLGAGDATLYRFPFARFESGVEVEGPPKNMLGLGLLCRILGWPPDLIRETVNTRFRNNPARLRANLEALELGLAAENPPLCPAPVGRRLGLLFETGNEAVARGAMEAGVQFFAGYPITPSSEIMETLLEELPPAGGRVVQAEDEIAAMGMVLGASFGGARAMTATSGPGLSLMTEMIGLSSMAELPAVIVDCQRAGPATGMPSRTEQSDLFHSVYGGHGDFPRAVLGVFDVVHAREVMHRAFHLAESYQIPVLVLSDAYVAQRRQIREPVGARKEPSYRARWDGTGPARFDLTGAHGVNPFRVPGDPGGTYLAAGIEHTPEGNPTADTATHQHMNEKRFKKLAGVARETKDWFRTLGHPAAPRGIIAWGSQYGILREWVAARPEYRVFLPEIVHPFPLEALERWRRGLQSLVVLELSYQGQFYRYLSGLTSLAGARSIARSGGVPLTLSELAQLLAEVKPC
jgi:2-oxoglutarate ferredoxin oxidoreductase subunit alpha